MLETCIIILNWFDCLCYLLLNFNRIFELGFLRYVSQVLSIEVLTWWSIFLWFKSSKNIKSWLTVMIAAQKQKSSKVFSQQLDIMRPSTTVLQADVNS